MVEGSWEGSPGPGGSFERQSKEPLFFLFLQGETAKGTASRHGPNRMGLRAVDRLVSQGGQLGCRGSRLIRLV
jgi:hypothetical protein